MASISVTVSCSLSTICRNVDTSHPRHLDTTKLVDTSDPNELDTSDPTVPSEHLPVQGEIYRVLYSHATVICDRVIEPLK